MYSITANFFPDNKEEMIGYIEAVTGVGLCFGPLIGSFLFSIGGYDFVFLSYGIFLLVCSLFVNNVFPKKVDGFSSQSEDDNYKLETLQDIIKDENSTGET